MSFSYDSSLSDSLSRVRFILQDTVETFADFSDEEISYYLTKYNDNVKKVAAELAFALYVKYAKMADVEETDELTLEYNDRAGTMKTLYEELSEDAMMSSGKPTMFFGGVSESQVRQTRSDRDNVDPLFTREGIYDRKLRRRRHWRR